MFRQCSDNKASATDGTYGYHLALKETPINSPGRKAQTVISQRIQTHKERYLVRHKDTNSIRVKEKALQHTTDAQAMRS